MCYCPTPTLHLNLALTGDGAFLFSLKKTHSVWFISVLNYGDTENVLINHLLLVISMSYPCHYTNLCPHKPHKHVHTHTHTHTHREHIYCCSARGAVGSSVPCSRVSPQSWYWRYWERCTFTPKSKWLDNWDCLGFGGLKKGVHFYHCRVVVSTKC